MGFNSIGIPGLIIILVVALLLFGPSKLPQLGKAVGQTLREFRTSAKEIREDVFGADEASEAKKEIDKE
ncbi:twin-arginine translocase TatA/TatE family subunit [Cytobacillus sp. Hz8]|uniref:twin-arginine translocase TatA/TatE family subunit n=1 Tax=Cytobacillus sp. Hz8 TaxID=3347168 RepID=UPI0035DCC619